MPETDPVPDFAAMSMDAIAAHIAAQKLPPVERWNPAHCGDSEMRIARDGSWFHQGSPIGRQPLVRQFARILRREPDGSFVLVTPGERLTITVEDAPFMAVEMKSEGSGPARRIAFRLNTDELVLAGPDNTLRFDPAGDAAPPYLHVRGGLEARVARPVYYELAALALAEAGSPPGVWSNGAFFAFGPV